MVSTITTNQHIVAARLAATQSQHSLVASLLKKTVWRYVLATFFVAIALLLEKLLQHFFAYPFLLWFFVAVIASAWYGGVGCGIFAVVLSIGVVDYFYIPPLDTLSINSHVIIYLAAFIVCAMAANWVSASVRKAQHAVEEARNELERRVEERTTQLQASSAELLKTQSELAHLSRALTMGELTSSIAHELRQPLTALIIHGETCVDSLALDPPNLDAARRAAARLIQDGSRAAAIIEHIRSLFRKESLSNSKEWLDLNDVIRELIAFYRDEAIRNHVSIQTQLAPDLPKINGDRVQLQQVVLNLVVNALDSMSKAPSALRSLTVISEARDGSVSVCVEDTGVGFDSETAEKLFVPFFTTKLQGMGMGLSISKTIIESHGGRLWAVACQPRGAVFEFTIPFTKAQVIANA